MNVVDGGITFITFDEVVDEIMNATQVVSVDF